MYSLGIDVGSSSVKASLLDITDGKCVGSATFPETEAPIKAVRQGWAEQDPDAWWSYLGRCITKLSATFNMSKVGSIGISYQMHGLVAVDSNVKPVRDAIIWCDSRAVETGSKALAGIGYDKCMEHLLNSPGNFTASKLAWVKSNEPDIYSRIWKFMLPGDYIAYKLTGTVSTTTSGLSEGILWDFKNNCRADFVADWFGIEKDKFADIVPSVGIQCRTNAHTQRLFGIPEGTPVSYRAGDQPNNAFSLNVLKPGEIAATGGTSGVVYGVTDKPEADPQSRVNTFLHVSGSNEPVLGVLLCINGCGILYSWARKNICPGMPYHDMDALSMTVPAGCEGLVITPFGNGAERMLGNVCPGAGMNGLDLVRHSSAHILRAMQEGLAFSFRYGIDIMKDLGLKPDVIRAGKANLFRSELFRKTLATSCNARIELYDTDGALGAARGAALGAKAYATAEEAFSTLEKLGHDEPVKEWKDALEESYQNWKTHIGL